MNKVQAKAQEKFIDTMDGILSADIKLIDKFSIINCILVDVIEAVANILEEVENKGAVKPRQSWVATVNRHLKKYSLEIYDTRTFH